MDKALVSIIAPCYNGAAYLLPFLESVLAQTYRPIELIFVDDGSSDKTKPLFLSWLDRLRDSGIRAYYYYQAHCGAAAAINTGLSHFSGQYVTWIDSDDIMTKDNIAEKVRYLQAHPEVGFVLAEAVIVNYPDLDTPVSPLRRIPPSGDDTLFSDLIYEKNIVFGPGMIMVRAEALREALPPEGIFESPQGQNWQLMLPLAYCFRCGYLEKMLLKCVSHPDSHSRTERSYRERLDRQKGFSELLQKTIAHIKQMPNQEKTYWRRRIRIKIADAVLSLAEERGDLFRYVCSTLKVMLNGGKVVSFGTRLVRTAKLFCHRMGRLLRK